jgi:hypothetical protein
MEHQGVRVLKCKSQDGKMQKLGSWGNHFMLLSMVGPLGSLDRPSQQSSSKSHTSTHQTRNTSAANTRLLHSCGRHGRNHIIKHHGHARDLTIHIRGSLVEQSYHPCPPQNPSKVPFAKDPFIHPIVLLPIHPANPLSCPLHRLRRHINGI